jgi:hypothetical protein
VASIDPPVLAPLDQSENDDRRNQENHDLNRGRVARLPIEAWRRPFQSLFFIATDEEQA